MTVLISNRNRWLERAKPAIADPYGTQSFEHLLVPRFRDHGFESNVFLTILGGLNCRTMRPLPSNRHRISSIKDDLFIPIANRYLTFEVLLDTVGRFFAPDPAQKSNARRRNL